MKGWFVEGTVAASGQKTQLEVRIVFPVTFFFANVGKFIVILNPHCCWLLMSLH